MERSEDGLAWQEIGRVSATGNSNSAQNYTYHASVAPNQSGLWYFRLGMVDQNGESTTSYIATVEACDAGTTAKLVPSIASQETRLEFVAKESGSGIVEIVDIEGKLVLEKKISLQPGQNAVEIQLNGLAPGTYTMSVRASNGNPIATGLRLVKR
ncbi:MAG: T9SS type A sorting domain-containing protein [Bacteroidia bacterium]